MADSGNLLNSQILEGLTIHFFNNVNKEGKPSFYQINRPESR